MIRDWLASVWRVTIFLLCFAVTGAANGDTFQRVATAQLASRFGHQSVQLGELATTVARQGSIQNADQLLALRYLNLYRILSMASIAMALQGDAYGASIYVEAPNRAGYLQHELDGMRRVRVGMQELIGDCEMLKSELRPAAFQGYAGQAVAQLNAAIQLLDLARLQLHMELHPDRPFSLDK